ncbi:MAG: hypothetical protein V3S60_06740, partial [Acidimicrobiia bacterium]
RITSKPLGELIGVPCNAWRVTVSMILGAPAGGRASVLSHPTENKTTPNTTGPNIKRAKDIGYLPVRKKISGVWKWGQPEPLA